MLACFPTVIILALGTAGSSPLMAQPPTFQHVVIDATNPANPHCKTLGDIDGDGYLDALAASSSGGGMFWYEYPGWTEHAIRASGSWTTDMQVGDVDSDGDLDVVTRKKQGGWTYFWKQESPTNWTRITVSSTDGEGTALADLDEDNDLDVVHNGFWLEQIDPTTWIEHTRVGNWFSRSEGIEPEAWC
jgi:hypothetical protein